MKKKFFSIICFLIVGQMLALNNTNSSNSHFDLDLVPMIDFTFDNNNQCSGTVITFTASIANPTSGAIYQYSWNFGDSTPVTPLSSSNTATHSYNSLGCLMVPYTVTLTVTENGTTTYIKLHDINIKQKPDISFTDVNSPFDPFSNCISASSSNPNYTITVGNSSISSPCISSYSINWGDSTPAELVSSFPVPHTYNQLGVYTMSITAIGSNGCPNTVTYTIKNVSSPGGGLSYPLNLDNSCASVIPYQFAITLWGLNSPDTYYIINYGDGNSQTLYQSDMIASGIPLSSPYPIPHAYTTSSCPGTFTISLIVANACRTNLPLTYPFHITKSPIANFNAPGLECITTSVLFNNISTPGYGNDCVPNTIFSWDFGDVGSPTNIIVVGPTSSTPNANHTFSSTGMHHVVLTAQNGCQPPTIKEKDICIEGPIPYADFTLTETPSIPITDCGPKSVVINNTTPNPSSCSEPTYTWVVTHSPTPCGTVAVIIPNQTTNQTTNPTYNFTVAGTYTITLTATNSCGSKVKTQVVKVTQPPTISSINVSNPIPCLSTANPTIQINPTLTLNDGCDSTISYNWYSSPSIGVSITNSNLANPTITFSQIGTYIITTEVTNDCGTAQLTRTFNINDAPTINSQPLASQTLCLNQIPTNLVVIPTGTGPFTYNWYDSNAPTVSLGSNSSFTPPTSSIGTHNYYCIISLNGSGNCSATSTNAEVIVNPAPSIDPQPIGQSVCLGQSNVNTLVVDYDNGPPIADAVIQWYSNTTGGNDIATSMAITGATGLTYTPTSTNSPMYYFCVISFPTLALPCNQIISNAAALTISPTPVIGPKNIELFCGDSLNFTPLDSSPDIVPSGTTYSWTAADITITPSGSVLNAIAENNQTSIFQNLVNNTANPATVIYNITPKKGNCIGVPFTLTVLVNPSILVSTPIVSNVTCTQVSGSNLNNGSITITSITGGVPFTTGNLYNITWNGPNGYTSNNQNISGLDPGDYTLSISDNSPCPPYEITVSVTAPPILGVTLLSQTNACFGDNNASINVTVSGGTPFVAPANPYTYSWTDSNNNVVGTNEDLPNISAGTYLLLVKDSLGCTTSLPPVTITQPSNPLIAALDNPPSVLCFGASNGSINVSVSGGTPFLAPANLYIYSWTNSNGVVIATTEDIPPSLIAGTYTLTVSDSEGCDIQLPVIITQSSDIIITHSSTPISCYGANDASITINPITGGTPPYSDLTWYFNGSTTPFANPGPYSFIDLGPGAYTIKMTDDNGCPKEITITIADLPVFSITPLVTNISCHGEHDGSIVLNAIGANASYVWYDNNVLSPITSSIRNNLAAGMYKVEVTNNDYPNCPKIIQTFSIIEPPTLVIDANTTNANDCLITNTGSIDLIVSGGTPPYSYAWSPNGEVVEDLTTLQAGSYVVTVTDSRVCTANATFIINRPDPITLKVEHHPSGVCDNLTEDFTATADGGLPPTQIIWSSGVTSGAFNQNMSTNQNGTIQVYAQDSRGCISQPVPPIDVQLPVIGTSSTPDASSVNFLATGEFAAHEPIQFSSTITGDYLSISWNFGDGGYSTANEQSLFHIYQEPGTYTVTLNVMYPFNCPADPQTKEIIITQGYVLVIPTAFTPNGDTLNDHFRPVVRALQNVRMDVYDTWGSLIYSETGIVLNGWDGKINGVNAENGNYNCRVYAETLFGEKITKSETFVLIK